MLARFAAGARAALRALAAAARRRWRLAGALALGVVALDVLVPPLVLSVARKPVDFFTVNPWLPRLPEFIRSGPGTLAERLEKTAGIALFWFSADNPYGVEWGFAVTVADLGRFLVMGLLVGLYFALWAYRRDRLAVAGWRARAARGGGVLGAVASVLGLATGGCTVMGCGAPVIPVVGLVFVGLSSTTLKWMAGVSSAATLAVLGGMALGVIYLAWTAGRLPAPGASRAP
jgi:hypothetical protein